jgi:hypothetical protein
MKKRQDISDLAQYLGKVNEVLDKAEALLWGHVRNYHELGRGNPHLLVDCLQVGAALGVAFSSADPRSGCPGDSSTTDLLGRLRRVGGGPGAGMMELSPCVLAGQIGQAASGGRLWDSLQGGYPHRPPRPCHPGCRW